MATWYFPRFEPEYTICVYKQYTQLIADQERPDFYVTVWTIIPCNVNFVCFESYKFRVYAIDPTSFYESVLRVCSSYDLR